MSNGSWLISLRSTPLHWVFVQCCETFVIMTQGFVDVWYVTFTWVMQTLIDRVKLDQLFFYKNHFVFEINYLFSMIMKRKGIANTTRHSMTY